MKNRSGQALDLHRKHSTNLNTPSARPGTSSALSSSEDSRPGTLAPAVADQLGPRRPGVIYGNVDGAFKVLDVITDASEARRILKRRSAQFAVIVIDTLRSGAEPFPVGSVWTGSDRVLKAVA